MGKTFRQGLYRAAVYARVSTEEQSEKGYSLDGQVEDCLRKAEELGYSRSQVMVLTDDVSGASADRPGLSRLREWVKEDGCRPETIIVYDPDRLARKLSLQLLLTDEWLKKGVRLEFVNFEWTDTPEGRLFYQLRGMFAEFEREKIRERTIRGRLTKLKTTGKLSWDPRLYGYRFDTERDILVADPPSAAVVRRIFRMAAGGASGEEIARRLAREGVPAPRGNRWHGSTVTRILHNRSYLGEYRAYKTDYHQGFKRQRPEEEQFPVPLEPLVVEELYEEAQRTLYRTRTRSGRPAKREVLLSGLGRCSCGRAMVASGASSGRDYSYYICSSKLKSAYPALGSSGIGGNLSSAEREPGDPCSGYWNTRVVDEAVWLHLSKHVADSREGLARLAEEGDAGYGGEASGQLAADYGEERRMELEKKKERLLDLYLSGSLDRERYEGKRRELEAEGERWHGRLEHSPFHGESGGGVQEDEAWKDPASFQAGLESLSADQRRRLAGVLLERVDFLPGRILQVHYRTGVLSGKPCDGEGHGGL